MYSPIKWTGSKRHLVKYLAPLFPKFERAIDPFVGGGSLLPYYGKCLASDNNPDLVALWNMIKLSPEYVLDNYTKQWNKLKENKEYYYQCRERYNKQHDCMDLLFLSRTCAAGVIRYNSRGEFNTSLHPNRDGIHPDRFKQIIKKWMPILNKVSFGCIDYRDVRVNVSDFVFCDPPYINSKGAVYGAEDFDYDLFFLWLDKLTFRGIRWMLTFKDKDIVPNIYTKRHSFLSGKSLLRDNKKEVVYESVYLNY